MRRPRIRAHICFVVLWAACGVGLTAFAIRDESLDEWVWAIFAWWMMGATMILRYRKFRGHKLNRNYGLVQFLRDSWWEDD